MTIPKSILEEWTSLHTHGDAIKISDLANVHPETVRRAIRTGRMSDELFQVIKEYYENKKDYLYE